MDDEFSLRIASADFNRCRNNANAFHLCTPDRIQALIGQKYAEFVERGDLRYPSIFRKALVRHMDSQSLIDELSKKLETEEEQRRNFLIDYMAHSSEIDAGVVAHLEVRRASQELKYRDELEFVNSEYNRRLRTLYRNEVPFGRSDVDRFLEQGCLLWLINAPEADAISFIECYLTDAMWSQLTSRYGVFDVEADSARAAIERLTIILNRAKQRRYPPRKLMYRPVKRKFTERQEVFIPWRWGVFVSY